MAGQNKLVIEVQIDNRGAEQGAQKLTGTIRGLGKGAQGASQGFDQLSKSANRAGAAFLDAGAQLFVINQAVSSLGPLFAAIDDAMNSVVATGGLFEAKMGDIGTLMGATGGRLEKFQDRMVQLLASMPVSADDLGAAAYQVISAGVTDASDALVVLENSAKLAIAGLSSMEASVDAVTSVLNAYNFTAQQSAVVSSILFNTVKFGKTTMEQISSSIGQIIPIAQAAGVSITELQAASAAATTGGIRIAETYTNARQAILSLLKPSAEMDRELTKMGFATAEGAVAALGLQGVLLKLREASQGNIAVFAKYFGRIQATTIATLLTGEASKSVTRNFKDMLVASTNLSEGFDIQSKRLDSIKQLRLNQEVALYVDIYDNWKDVLKRVNTSLTSHLEFLNRLRQEYPAVAKGVDLVAFAFGSVAGGVQSLLNAFASLLTVVIGLQVLKRMEISVLALLNPFKLWAAAVGLVTRAYGALIFALTNANPYFVAATLFLGALASAVEYLNPGTLSAVYEAAKQFLGLGGEEEPKGETLSHRIEEEAKNLEISAAQYLEAGEQFQAGVKILQAGILRGQPPDIQALLTGMSPEEIAAMANRIERFAVDGASDVEAAFQAIKDVAAVTPEMAGMDQVEQIEFATDALEKAYEERLAALNALREEQRRQTPDESMFERGKAVVIDTAAAEAALATTERQLVALKALGSEQARLTLEQRTAQEDIILNLRKIASERKAIEAQQTLNAQKQESLLKKELETDQKQLTFIRKRVSLEETVLANMQAEQSSQTLINSTYQERKGLAEAIYAQEQVVANVKRDELNQQQHINEAKQVFLRTLFFTERGMRLTREEQDAILNSVDATNLGMERFGVLSELARRTIAGQPDEFKRMLILLRSANVEGEQLAADFTAVMQALRDAGISLDDFTNNLNTAVNVGELFTDTVSGALSDLITGQGSLNDLFTNFGDVIIADFSRAFAEVLKEKAGFDTAFQLNMEGDILGTVTKVTDQMSSAFGKAFDFISGKIPGVTNAIDGLGTALNGVLDALSDIVPLFGQVNLGVVDLQGALSNAAGGAGTGFTVAGLVGANQRQQRGAAIGGAVQKGLLPELKKILPELYKGLFKTLKNDFLPVIGDLFGATNDILEAIGLPIGELRDKAGKFFDFEGGIGAFLKKGFEGIEKVAQKAFNFGTQLLTKSVAKLGDVVGSLLGKEGVGGAVSSALGSVFSGIGSAVSAAFQGAVSIISGVMESFSSVIPVLGELAGSAIGFLFSNEKLMTTVREFFSNNEWAKKTAVILSAGLGALLFKALPSRRDIARNTFESVFEDALDVDVRSLAFQGSLQRQTFFQDLSRQAKITASTLAVLATGIKTPAKNFEEFDIALSQLALAFATSGEKVAKNAGVLAAVLGGDLEDAIDLFIKQLPKITRSIIKEGGKGLLDINRIKVDPLTGKITDRQRFTRSGFANQRQELIDRGLIPDLVTGLIELVELLRDGLPETLRDVPAEVVKLSVAEGLKRLGRDVVSLDLTGVSQEEQRRIYEELVADVFAKANEGLLAQGKGLEVLTKIFNAFRFQTEGLGPTEAELDALKEQGVRKPDSLKGIRIREGEETRFLQANINDFLIFARELARGVFTGEGDNEGQVDRFFGPDSQLIIDKQFRKVLDDLTLTQGRELQNIFQEVARNAIANQADIFGDDVTNDFQTRLDELVAIFIAGTDEAFDTVEEILAALNQEFNLNLKIEDLDLTGEDVVRRLQIKQEAFAALTEAFGAAAQVLLANEGIDESIKAFGLKLRDVMIARTQEAMNKAFFSANLFDNLLATPMMNLEIAMEKFFADLREQGEDFDAEGEMNKILAMADADFQVLANRIEAMGPAIEKFAELQERIILAMTTFTQSAQFAQDFIDSIDLMMAAFSGEGELATRRVASEKAIEKMNRAEQERNEIFARGVFAAGPSGANDLDAVLQAMSGEDLKRYINALGAQAEAVTAAYNAQIAVLEEELRIVEQMAGTLQAAEDALATIRGVSTDPQEQAMAEFERERGRVQDLIRQFRTGSDAERAAAASELAQLGPRLLELAQAAGLDPGSREFEDVRSTLEVVMEEVIVEAKAAAARAEQIQQEIKTLQEEANLKLQEIKQELINAQKEADRRAKESYTETELEGDVGTLDNLKTLAEKQMQRLNEGINVYDLLGGKVAEKRSPFEAIPLNEGGVVTGREVPALLHGPEAVIPLDKFPALMAGMFESRGLRDVQNRSAQGERQTRALEDIREVLVVNGSGGTNVEIKQEIAASLVNESGESDEFEFQQMMLKLMPRLMRQPKVRRAIVDAVKGQGRRG